MEVVEGDRPRLSNAVEVKTGETLEWSDSRVWLRRSTPDSSSRVTSSGVLGSVSWYHTRP